MIKRNNLLMAGVILVVVAVLLSPLLSGAGQNWDWTFPLFSEQMAQFLNRHLSAWNPVNSGFPLSYSPHLFASSVIAALGFLPFKPELIQWVLIVSALTATAYLGALIAQRYDKKFAVIWGIAIVVNSAIFYKLLAGHLFYILALPIYLGLVYFLIQHYRPNFKSGLIVGLLWALSGVQIQFLVFSLITIIGFFIFRRDYLRFRDIAVSVLIVFFLHLYWLILFITGGTDFQAVSATARAETFPTLMRSSLNGILGLRFSPATFISNFYNVYLAAFFSVLWFFACIVALFRPEKNRESLIWLTLLGIFLIIASGTFQAIQVPILASIYPMLREVGHAGPIVVTLLLVFIASQRPKSYLKWVIYSYLFIFISISGYMFYNYVPRMSFESARQHFQGFISPSQNREDTSRVLTYPFFNQYSFKDAETRFRGGTPMSNSGWDSFIIFSGLDYIENGISPHKFPTSLQRQLLETNDVSMLAERNIRYIYDFSNIYESTYDRFVAPEVYENNLSLIKNDPNFIQKIIDSNPGEVRLVAPNILEIINYSPRISGEGVSFKKVTETRYEIRIENKLPVTTIKFLSSFHPGWKLFESDASSFNCDSTVRNECVTHDKPLFVGDELKFFTERSIADEAHQQLDPVGNSWNIPKSNENNTQYLTLYYQPQSWFIIGLIVSLLTLIASIGYLAITRKST